MELTLRSSHTPLLCMLRRQEAVSPCLRAPAIKFVRASSHAAPARMRAQYTALGAVSFIMGLLWVKSCIDHGGELQYPRRASATQRVACAPAPSCAGLQRRRCAGAGPEVCSHQASGGDVSQVNGSLAAFRSLWQHGVYCYDMDGTALADAVLVTHPARLMVRRSLTPLNVRQSAAHSRCVHDCVQAHKEPRMP